MQEQLIAPPGAERERRGPPAHGVQIVDTPTVRVHHPSDLVGAVLSALGIALVLALATYAPNTTTGVAEDVQGFATILGRITIGARSTIGGNVWLTHGVPPDSHVAQATTRSDGDGVTA